MARRDIVVIGASAGGIAPLKNIVRGLPKDFSASVFIVWHSSPDITSVLPKILDRETHLSVQEAIDKEPIVPGRIYIAKPDYHLLLEKETVRVTKGPKENRFRPAVDPLFRSAAQSFGPRVIGIVLSGRLNDGTAGLWTIKNRGGTAIAQDPMDAEVSSMPMSAIRDLDIDHILASAEMPELLDRLTSQEIPAEAQVNMKDDKKTTIEVGIALGRNAFESGVLELGEPSSLTCPECRGAFVRLMDDNIIRFRCHTGHAYSLDTLLAAVSEEIEDSFWNTVRTVEENIMLLNLTSDDLEKKGQIDAARRYKERADKARRYSERIRQMLLEHVELKAGG